MDYVIWIFMLYYGDTRIRLFMRFNCVFHYFICAWEDYCTLWFYSEVQTVNIVDTSYILLGHIYHYNKEFFYDRLMWLTWEKLHRTIFHQQIFNQNNYSLASFRIAAAILSSSSPVFPDVMGSSNQCAGFTCARVVGLADLRGLQSESFVPTRSRQSAWAACCELVRRSITSGVWRWWGTFD